MRHLLYIRYYAVSQRNKMIETKSFHTIHRDLSPGAEKIKILHTIE